MREFDNNILKMKRAEITTTQIVLLIILIVSFAVLIFFMARFGFGEESDKEICHNSVVLKSKSTLSGELNCKTSYVCISSGGKCENFNADETIKVKENKDEVFNAIRDEMVNCWWMFGNGDVDYSSTEWGFDENHCAICSIVRFDSTLQEKFKEGFDYSDFYNSMNANYNASGESYIKYLYDSDSVEAMQNNLPSGKILLNNEYLIITGIGKKGGWFTKEKSILVQFMTSDDITKNEICDVYDISRA